MTRNEPAGFPPAEVTALLRLEGLVVLVAATAAYFAMGGSWWLFLLLLLTPDIAMLGMLLGPVAGTRLYNAAHTYAAPAVLAAVAWFAGIGWLLPIAAIWVAHIGIDRVLGYGLKYPGRFGETHLGRMGAGRKAKSVAHAG